MNGVSPWLPLGLGAASALAVLVRLPGIIAAMYGNADAASAPVIGALIGSAPAGRTVLLGQYPWYESLWLMQLTRWLPAHRELWEAAPIVFAAVAYALLVASCWWCFGRTRALLLAALLLSTTVELRTVLFSLNFHGSIVLHACVLAASLTVVIAAKRLPVWGVAVFAVLVGLFTALGVASDQMMFIGAILPMLLTGLSLWVRHPEAVERRAGLFAVSVCMIAVLVGEFAAAIMRHDRIVAAPFTLTFVPLGRVLANLEIFVASFTNLAGGNFFGGQATFTGCLTLASGVLALLGLGLVIRWVWRNVAVLRTPPPHESPRSIAGTAYIIFWVWLLVCLTAGFVLTSAPVDASSARYLAAGFVAVAALLTCLAPIRGRIANGALALGITTFCALTLYFNLTHINGEPGPYPTGPVVGDIERYLIEHHATRGYAPYEVAADITWATNLRIQAYPLERCATPLGVCPMDLHQISTWYQSSGQGATFLLTDLSQVGNVPVPDPFGTPTAEAAFGQVMVYIYPHDVATAFQT